MPNAIVGDLVQWKSFKDDKIMSDAFGLVVEIDNNSIWIKWEYVKELPKNIVVRHPLKDVEEGRLVII